MAEAGQRLLQRTVAGQTLPQQPPRSHQLQHHQHCPPLHHLAHQHPLPLHPLQLLLLPPPPSLPRQPPPPAPSSPQPRSAPTPSEPHPAEAALVAEGVEEPRPGTRVYSGRRCRRRGGGSPPPRDIARQSRPRRPRCAHWCHCTLSHAARSPPQKGGLAQAPGEVDRIES